MAEYVTLLDCVRDRVGISEDIYDYDEDIRLYIRDALADMRDSGCLSSLLPQDEDAPVSGTDERVLTAVSCYVMAREMGHEGTLTSSTVMLTTFFSAFTRLSLRI